MADDKIFMKQALEEAKTAFREGEIPIGAIIECKGRIIARAHNLTERLTDVTAHAEMQAITAAAEYLGGKYLTECTLYVTVEPWDGRRSAVSSMVRATRSEDSCVSLPKPCTLRRKWRKESWKKNVRN